MKQHIEIEQNGTVKQISVEPVTYHAKTMYELAFDDQFIIVYQDADGWKQEDKQELSEELVSKAGSAIEDLIKEGKF